MDTLKFLHILLTLTAIVSLTLTPTQAQLSPTFYNTTCPNLTAIVRATITQAVSQEARMAASLIRLHFHDCFVQGCDASILLDSTATIQSEKVAAPNNNSVRGYNVIDAAKLAVESACPGVVSCADIVTIAAREATVAAGGPSWTLKLGRRDSTTANLAAANAQLPGPTDSLQDLTTAFANQGLSLADMIALSGAHTIGRSKCLFFRARIYSNGTDIDPTFATTRQATCPQTGGDSNLAPFDSVTADFFDNSYYSNLVARRGLLQSDQILTSNGTTNATINLYSNNAATFATDFANAMIKMSEITPTLSPNGIIRKVCTAIN